MRIVNKNYQLKTNYNKTISLISDIHYYSKKDIKHLNKVLNKIKKTNPDFICVSGDIIDEVNILDKNEFINWLSNLSIVAPVVIVLGNHEYYLDKKNKKFEKPISFIKELKNIKNLYLLDNENKIIDNINFIGITMPIDYYFNEQNNQEILNLYLKKIKVEKNKYNILLCHSPINICDEKILKNSGMNLVLCGHMHGGITPRIFRCIIKNGGIISPTGQLFPKEAYGHIKKYSTDIVITSGITVISHINKFKMLKNFFSSEIAIIKI